MSKKNKKTDIDSIVKKIEGNDFEFINKNNSNNNFFIVFLSIIVLISSILYFVSVIVFKKDNLDLFNDFIKSIILVLFSICFICNINKYYGKKKFCLFISMILLIMYNAFSILTNYGLISYNFNQVEDFRGKSLTYMVKWASKNNVLLIQDYEYSDMVDEYHVIDQDCPSGKNIKDLKSITVSISQGANPYKEVFIPSMVTWNDEKVLKFINDNHLENVNVSFVESDKVKNTVISQSKSGNMMRNEELELVFSLGDDELEDTKLIDLTGKSKFEAMFYLKQHAINYEIESDFSSKVKKDYVLKQSIKPGSVIKAHSEDVLKFTISKGKKIKVPDLNKMSLSEITNWVIKNKLKIEFSEQYDESVKDNKVISTNYKKGDIIEQSTLIKVVISRGQLYMKSFDSLDKFKEWANKNNIKYQEEYEFSDSVESGKVISYSHKKGDIIKNDDVIIIKISDGKEIEVPDVVGMSRSDIVSKLKKIGLNYSFIYTNSNSVSKDKAISQSISSGSKVSNGTTITITLSNGKKEENTISKREKTENSSKSSSSSKSNTNTNTNSSTNNSTTVETSSPVNNCNTCSFRSSQIYSIIEQHNDCEAAANALKSSLQSKCQGLTVNVSCQAKDGYNPADFISGFNGGNVSSCDSISIVLAN